MASSSFRTYSSASTTSTRVSENELERRRIAYEAQAWIKGGKLGTNINKILFVDEQRRAEQGISTDKKIAELFDHVEEQGRDLPEGVRKQMQLFNSFNVYNRFKVLKQLKQRAKSSKD